MDNSTIYYIRYDDELLIGWVEVEKETEKLYYLSKPINSHRILRKVDEASFNDDIVWTADKQCFEALKKKFVIEKLSELKAEVKDLKILIKKLRKNAKKLKIKV